MSDNRKKEVIIIGGGLAGLACGVQLATRGVDFEILEATDRVGGRVRTDVVDGFQLDHGFQVFLTAYPAAQQLLDYDRLQLQTFEPGALVRYGDQFSALLDPRRRPGSLFASALSPVGSLADKLRLARLMRDVCRGELEEIWEHVAQPTCYRLQGLNFSDRFIDQFFRPLLGGIFLDRDLQTSSRIMEFVLRMLAQGEAAIPAQGMQAIPQQLADRIPADRIHPQATVLEIDGTTVRMTDGSQRSADQIVIATESSAAARLLKIDDAIAWQQVSCLYFAADEPPLKTKQLILSGDTSGPINNVCEVSTVAADYAPAGKSLISVSVLQTDVPAMELRSPVLNQLRGWFGEQVDGWSLLRTYHIPFALPYQSIDRMQPVCKPVQRGGMPIVCGDHCETSSIQGALHSGIRAADAVFGRLGDTPRQPLRD
ncbi:Protoporphyrinogen oxidase [Rosistilla carotiformis]|uniref:Protoporphyrinogen oxidase n=1 Tax=Rosistilla carotiformis TaxID=2528017 RepID=A0A518JPY2_9BACT|nr:NAD(P)/FAD-dependent oxidoreductase [Rosistilla carotiformis]QDV67596.1 Protoporphyrinogen oxidase [Rosistilla carotiformis]